MIFWVKVVANQITLGYAVFMGLRGLAGVVALSLLELFFLFYRRIFVLQPQHITTVFLRY